LIEGLLILHAPLFSCHQAPDEDEDAFDPGDLHEASRPDKMSVRDDEGTAIAYTRDGVVYSPSTGGRIAELRLGQLYTADGQILGMLMPSGRVRGVGGEAASSFMRLFGGE
jgi:hypothetical protein